jgi:cholesterol oxidase
MAEVHSRTSGDGIRFRERMLTPRGRRALGPAADLRLDVSFPGLDAFLLDDSHILEISGTVTIGTIATERPARGSLSLFPRGSEDAMRYTIEFDDDRGEPWRLTGVKTLPGRGPVALWAGLTRLRWEARPTADEGAQPRNGIVSLGPVAVARLLTAIRGEGFTRARRIAVVARFVGFFSRAALASAITSRNRTD